jgi:hypothetical protein
VPFHPGSPGRRVRPVRPGSVLCQRYRSHRPPTFIAAVRGHVSPTRRAAGRDHVGWCHGVTSDVGEWPVSSAYSARRSLLKRAQALAPEEQRTFGPPRRADRISRWSPTLLGSGRGVGLGVVGAARAASRRGRGYCQSWHARPRPAGMSFRHPWLGDRAAQCAVGGPAAGRRAAPGLGRAGVRRLPRSANAFGAVVTGRRASHRRRRGGVPRTAEPERLQVTNGNKLRIRRVGPFGRGPAPGVPPALRRRRRSRRQVIVEAGEKSP